MSKKSANLILVIIGLILIIYGILCYTPIVVNRFHKDFGFIFIGLGIAAIYWGAVVSRTEQKVMPQEKIWFMTNLVK